MIIRSDETEDIAVPGAGAMRLHLFRPAVDGRVPGVLFFSEIYQVTEPIRRLAAMVAGQGYLVAVPEVYHEYEPPGTVLAYDKPGTDRGNALKTTKPVAAFDADARAGLAWLRAHPACTGRLATLGVCLGGHLAYRAALDPSVSAAACFYATDIHAGTLGAGKTDDSLARMDELKAETRAVRRPPGDPRAAGGRRRPLRMARGERRPRLPARRGAALRPGAVPAGDGLDARAVPAHAARGGLAPDCVMSDPSSRHREPPLGGVAIQDRRTAAWRALPWIASSLRSSQ
jgi:carboxymethylenebutenolidase